MYFRSFDHLYFWMPVGFVMLLGLILSEESKDSTFMNRQQTEEWKGKSKDFNVEEATKSRFLLDKAWSQSFLNPPSSRISSCVRTVDTVMCLHTWCSPAM